MASTNTFAYSVRMVSVFTVCLIISGENDIRVYIELIMSDERIYSLLSIISDCDIGVYSVHDHYW
jgi:hypothetical protein